MKSLNATHPDFGFASRPVDVQRYVNGREHVVVDPVPVETGGRAVVVTPPPPLPPPLVHERH